MIDADLKKLLLMTITPNYMISYIISKILTKYL
jgi:hypothetical protein